MKATDSRHFDWKRLGRGRKPAPVLIALLLYAWGILLAYLVPVRSVMRKLILAAVAASLVFSPLAGTFASATSENVAHAALTEQQAADHSHGHDDHDCHGSSAGHTHGHDPADHSHQYAFLSGGNGPWGLPPSQRWPTALSGLPDGTSGLAIERPPKRAMSH